MSLRYKNLFVTASHYLDTDFDFPEITTAAVFVESGVPSLTTIKLSASRLEWDAALGYFLHPYVAVTAGYKFIEQDFTFRSTVTFPPAPESTSQIFEVKTEISGPFVSLIASVPIGGGVGVYGNFAYGFLESEFKNGFEGDEQSQPYILAEGGFTYTPTTDYLPAYMPLSSATVYAGYRYQDFDTESGGFGDFNDEEIRDLSRGFVVGVNLSF